MNNTSFNYSIIMFLAISLSILACKPSAPAAKENTQKVEMATAVNLPSKLKKVMDAHGGMDAWNSMKSMSYEMGDDEDVEKQFVDLRDRRERIETADYNMGYDGANFWTDADTTVKQNPIFYKNLMFYFYAMPFVLADKGINYTEAPNLVYDGVEYPGFRISYDKGVGVSPEDEYFIHYDAKTNEMAWLGYTVTYFSQEKSTKIKWIRYDDWKSYNGLKLPASMMWYENEENKPLKERSRRAFKNVQVSKEAFADDKFKATPEARIVTE